jgi:hypothetical protein
MTVVRSAGACGFGPVHARAIARVHGAAHVMMLALVLALALALVLMVPHVSRLLGRVRTSRGRVSVMMLALALALVLARVVLHVYCVLGNVRASPRHVVKRTTVPATSVRGH